ncbi:hypothetical protein GOP47_0012651 [Adiantum capillus-veneris]|nr:hypothetical protein GOP47_0012651 [Adiantum capillus-veneris]
MMTREDLDLKPLTELSTKTEEGLDLKPLMELSTTTEEGGDDDQFLDFFDMIFLAIDGAAFPVDTTLEDMMVEPLENPLMTLSSSTSTSAFHDQYLSHTLSKVIGEHSTNMTPPTIFSIPCTSQSQLSLQDDDVMCDERDGSDGRTCPFGSNKFTNFSAIAKAGSNSTISCHFSAKEVHSSCLHTRIEKKAAPANATSNERRIWGVRSRRRLDFKCKTMSEPMVSLLPISKVHSSKVHNMENAMVPSVSDHECTLMEHRESECSLYGIQDDLETEKSRSPSGNLACKRKTGSRNLISERRRRRNLNDKLFSLRALVPNISKLDKASIVADAIEYVRDLQRQVEEVSGEVSQLVATKEVAQQTNDGLYKNTSTSTNTNTDINSIGLNPCLKCPSQSYQYTIVKIGVTFMEGKMYHAQLQCKKGHGVLVKLTQAIEALEVDIISANFSVVNDHILNTLMIEVKEDRSLLQEEVHQKVRETMLTYGFTFEL